VAPAQVPGALDGADKIRKARPATCSQGCSRSHSTNVFRQSALGAPRILGELGSVGIVVAKSTVEKYMVRKRKPPSPTWRAFLENHVTEIVAIDFFVVPTVRRRILYVFLVLAHDRRRVLHFNVTSDPTAEWTAQQVVEAFRSPLRQVKRIASSETYYSKWPKRRFANTLVLQALLVAIVRAETIGHSPCRRRTVADSLDQYSKLRDAGS